MKKGGQVPYQQQPHQGNIQFGQPIIDQSQVYIVPQNQIVISGGGVQQQQPIVQQDGGYQLLYDGEITDGVGLGSMKKYPHQFNDLISDIVALSIVSFVYLLISCITMNSIVSKAISNIGIAYFAYFLTLVTFILCIASIVVGVIQKILFMKGKKGKAKVFASIKIIMVLIWWICLIISIIFFFVTLFIDSSGFITYYGVVPGVFASLCAICLFATIVFSTLVFVEMKKYDTSNVVFSTSSVVYYFFGFATVIQCISSVWIFFVFLWKFLEFIVFGSLPASISGPHTWSYWIRIIVIISSLFSFLSSVISSAGVFNTRAKKKKIMFTLLSLIWPFIFVITLLGESISIIASNTDDAHRMYVGLNMEGLIGIHFCFAIGCMSSIWIILGLLYLYYRMKSRIQEIVKKKNNPFKVVKCHFFNNTFFVISFMFIFVFFICVRIVELHQRLLEKYVIVFITMVIYIALFLLISFSFLLGYYAKAKFARTEFRKAAKLQLFYVLILTSCIVAFLITLLVEVNVYTFFHVDVLGVPTPGLTFPFYFALFMLMLGLSAICVTMEIVSYTKMKDYVDDGKEGYVYFGKVCQLIATIVNVVYFVISCINGNSKSLAYDISSLVFCIIQVIGTIAGLICIILSIIAFLGKSRMTIAVTLWVTIVVNILFFVVQFVRMAVLMPVAYYATEIMWRNAFFLTETCLDVSFVILHLPFFGFMMCIICAYRAAGNPNQDENMPPEQKDGQGVNVPLQQGNYQQPHMKSPRELELERINQQLMEENKRLKTEITRLKKMKGVR